MWEGQATSRRQQIAAGIGLAVVASPFLLFGIAALFMMISKGKLNIAFVIVGLVSLLIGSLSVVLAYRLISARGVSQGGGLLSPIAFKVGGYIFLILSLLFSYGTINDFNCRSLAGVVAALFISFMFFVAARHRGAMRRFK